MKQSKVIVITGASSGIGRAVAKILCEKGHTVYSFSRRGESAPGVISVPCDVTEEEQIKAAVGQVIADAGRIDVLICAAGFGIAGVSETTPLPLAKKQFDVNFFGAVSAVSAVLPQMRKQGYGRIVGISSLASVFPIPFQSFYSASKAAMDAYFFALANEIKPFGITVCCVRPGDTATGFTAAREKSDGTDGYGERSDKSIARMEKDEQGGMSAEKVGRTVAKTALKSHSRPFVIPGGTNRLLGFLSKILPSRMIRKIVGVMYSK